MLKLPVDMILEHVHVSDTAVTTRLWRCTNGERDETRTCRIFREVLPPVQAVPPECPVFDELIVKKPLTFQ